MDFDESGLIETPEEIAEYEAMYKRKRDREKDQKTNYIETGKIELNIRVPNILPGNIKYIVRDIRRTLENCAMLNLLDEFAVERVVEYEEVLGAAVE